MEGRKFIANLRWFAGFSLYLGFIAGFFVFITLGTRLKYPDSPLTSGRVMDWSGLFLSLACVFQGVFLYLFLNVVCVIADTLIDIKNGQVKPKD